MTPLLLLTDRRQARRPLPELVRDVGVTTVLREKDLPRGERFRLAEQLRAVGADLIVAGPDPLGGTAVHLAAADPDPPGGVRWVGRSCHDEAELLAAVDAGVDYVTVSPVFSTVSKPGYGPALGWSALARLVALAGPVPVYALGGIETPDQVAGCLAAGAAGVAVMGALMRAADPAGLARDLLRPGTGPEPARNGARHPPQ